MTNNYRLEGPEKKDFKKNAIVFLPKFVGIKYQVEFRSLFLNFKFLSISPKHSYFLPSFASLSQAHIIQKWNAKGTAHSKIWRQTMQLFSPWAMSFRAHRESKYIFLRVELLIAHAARLIPSITAYAFGI